MTLSQSEERQLERLRNQVNWVTRLSTALTATQSIEDLASILIAGYVSPTGLGYSRVLYFEFDNYNFALRGKYAIFHDSKESYNKLLQELKEEEDYLEHFEEAHLGSKKPDDKVLREAEMDSLAATAPWIVMFQKLNPENEFTAKLENLVYPCPDPETGVTYIKGKSGGILEDAQKWRRARAFKLSEHRDQIPEDLQQLLTEDFAVVPLITMKGLRALLVIDKHLQEEQEFTPEDLADLERFGKQGAIALENVEARSDLGQANSDLMQLDQMKSNFLSIISHELRTPLTALSGFVDLIVDERVGEINENQRSLLKRVQKNTGHLIHLVNDLIELAEIEAEGAVDVKISPINPLVVLTDTLPRLEQRRREMQVEVVPVVECDVPTVLADERALGRIFFHLIDNAMKFSTDGSKVEVRIRIEQGECCIEVCDEGVGIPEEHLKRIFDQFYQVDNSLTRGHEGLGLGLAVSRLLINAIHGRIFVHSELGYGSTFSIRLPIQNQ